jgi:hypothetical protein
VPVTSWLCKYNYELQRGCEKYMPVVILIGFWQIFTRVPEGIAYSFTVVSRAMGNSAKLIGSFQEGNQDPPAVGQSILNIL